MARKQETAPLPEASDDLGDLIERASGSGERVVLSRNGKPVATLVSLTDLEALEAYEDAADTRVYDEAKATFEADGRRTVSLEGVRTRLTRE